MDYTVPGILQARILGSRSLLQGIVLTQGSNAGLPHCRQILYQLRHKGSPRIQEWVAYPSPADLCDLGIKPGSPALQADSLPTELVWEVYILTETVVTWVYPFVKTKQNVHFK